MRVGGCGVTRSGAACPGAAVPLRCSAACPAGRAQRGWCGQGPFGSVGGCFCGGEGRAWRRGERSASVVRVGGGAYLRPTTGSPVSARSRISSAVCQFRQQVGGSVGAHTRRQQGWLRVRPPDHTQQAGQGRRQEHAHLGACHGTHCNIKEKKHAMHGSRVRNARLVGFWGGRAASTPTAAGRRRSRVAGGAGAAAAGGAPARAGAAAGRDLGRPYGAAAAAGASGRAQT